MAGRGFSGRRFQAGESITSEKLHAVIEDATFSDFDQTNMASGAGLVIYSSTAPTDTEATWHNSTLDLLRIHNGTEWYPVNMAEIMTNVAGVTLNRGDVVVIDTANDSSVTRTTSASNVRVFGVALETITAGSRGVFGTAGVHPVNFTGTPTIATFAFTSTTAGKAVHGSAAANAFGLVLEASTNLAACYLFGHPAL